MGHSEIEFSGKLQMDKGLVTVNLLLYLFEENETSIVYCPALDLSAYAPTEQEALNAWPEVLAEYLLYTTRKKTLSADLQMHGWTVKRKMVPPPVEQVIQKNPEFMKIFSEGNYKQVDYSAKIPKVYS